MTFNTRVCLLRRRLRRHFPPKHQFLQDPHARRIPEDGTLHSHRREHLKSYIFIGYVYSSVCVCVCVCERERERASELGANGDYRAEIRQIVSICVFLNRGVQNPHSCAYSPVFCIAPQSRTMITYILLIFLYLLFLPSLPTATVV
jgi:hypothetical protein